MSELEKYNEWPGTIFFVAKQGGEYTLESTAALEVTRKYNSHRIVEVVELPLDYHPTLAEAVRDYLAGVRPRKEHVTKAKEEFLERLRRIIETSEHEGERFNAAALMERIMKKSI